MAINRNIMDFFLLTGMVLTDRLNFALYAIFSHVAHIIDWQEPFP